MLSSPGTWFGELLLPVAPLALEYPCCCSRTSMGTAWDGKTGRSNSIPAFTALTPLLKLFTCTKPAQLSSLGSGNPCHQTQRAEGWSNISVMGLGGGKETPVLWGALLGQGDEPWHGARVPPRTGPPSSPCIRAKVTSPKAFPSLEP